MVTYSGNGVGHLTPAVGDRPPVDRAARILDCIEASTPISAARRRPGYRARGPLCRRQVRWNDPGVPLQGRASTDDTKLQWEDSAVGSRPSANEHTNALD